MSSCKKINPTYIKKVNLCKEFEQQKDKLKEKYSRVYATYIFDKDDCNYSIYSRWGTLVRQYSYMEQVTLFFTNKDIFDDYYNIMKKWVLEVEQPLNNNIEVYHNDLEFDILVRPRLFGNKFKYKAAIPYYASLQFKPDNLYNTIVSVFSDKISNTVHCKLNYYTITFLTNDLSDLLLLQLTAGKKLRFQQIIKPEEIME